MTKNTSIMVQVPSATHLIDIADLWAEMQKELGQTADLEERKQKYEAELRDMYRDRKVFSLAGVRMMGDERAGEVVAFMNARLVDADPPYGRLIDLYVQPSLRGNNLAKHMLEAATGWLRAQKAEFIEVSTLTKNRLGMAFLAEAEFQLHSSVLRKTLK